MRMRGMMAGAAALIAMASAAACLADGNAAGAQAGGSAAVKAAGAGDGNSSDEALSRQLLELKARRAALSGQSAELDGEILELRERLAERYRKGVDGKQAEASSGRGAPAFPRIVAPAAEEGNKLGPGDFDGDALRAQTGEADVDADSPENVITRVMLRKTVTIQVDKQPLAAVLAELGRQARTNFSPAWHAMQTAGVDKDTPVTIDASQVPAARALRMVLDAVGGDTAHLGFTVADGAVVVSTEDDLDSAKYQEVRVFDVRDLLALQAGDYSAQLIRGAYQQRATDLTDTIMSVVAPDTWRDNGGTVGSIRVIDGLLIVNQTADNQAAVAMLLEKLRRR